MNCVLLIKENYFNAEETVISYHRPVHMALIAFDRETILGN